MVPRPRRATVDDEAELLTMMLVRGVAVGTV
jgi:hypothetical protein